jgi:hypothetical protein
MPSRSGLLFLALSLALPLAACTAPSAPIAANAPSEPPHHHELNLPPVGPAVTIRFEGKSVDVALASVKPVAAGAITFADLWRAAWPSEAPAPLKFDFVGSDGFRSMARPRCTRLLTGVDLATATLDVTSHDLHLDEALKLPGCYRVRAVVAIDVSR